MNGIRAYQDYVGLSYFHATILRLEKKKISKCLKLMLI